MVSFGRQSDFRVGDEDFQDIRGVGYNDDFVITPQASSSTEDAVNHLRSKSQMSNESDKASMLDEAIEYLNTLKMQFRIYFILGTMSYLSTKPRCLSLTGSRSRNQLRFFYFFPLGLFSNILAHNTRTYTILQEKKTVCADLVYGAKNKKLSVKELLECQPRFSISQSGSLPVVKFIVVSMKEGMFNNANVFSASSLWTASPLCRELCY